MTVESATYPAQFNTAWPTAADWVSEGDDHIRLIKTVVKTTFPNVAGAVNATDVQLNYVTGVTSNIQSQLNGKGAITGQTWTGAHVFSGSAAVPTLAQGTNTTGAASTAFVQAEWATRLPNYSAPITASSAELNYSVGVTSAIQTQINGKGAIAGQTWSGTHDYTGATINVPTRTVGDSTAAAASTAFVTATSFASALPGQSGNANKFVTTDGVNSFWAFPFLFDAVVSATTQTAVAGLLYRLENAGATTLTLPASPSNGDVVGVICINARRDNVVARNGNAINGIAQDITLDNPYFPYYFRFFSGKGWYFA